MTNFPPETYLAAARIACPQYKWLDGRRLPVVALNEGDSFPTIFFDESTFGLLEFNCKPIGNFYRALREALDKEHRITIYWADEDRLWESYQRGDKTVPDMNNEDITWIMLMNVQALIEAGVVE